MNLAYINNKQILINNNIYDYKYMDGILSFNKESYIKKNNLFVNNNKIIQIKKESDNGKVFVIYLGRLGNNIFQYVYARLFAEKNNLELETIIPKIKSTKQNTWKIKKQKCKNNFIIINDSSGNVLEKKYDNGIFIFNGYFQKSWFYNQYKEKIKTFFQIDYPKIKNKEDIVMNVRLGDYKTWRGGKVIHPNWYLDILKQETFNRLHIVTDEPNHEYFLNFKNYNPIIYHDDKNLLNDMLYMMKFDKFICSNSTYGWWAAFLGDASKIYVFKKWVDYSFVDLVKINNSIVLDGNFYV